MPREGRTGWSETAELAGFAELEDDYPTGAPTLSAKKRGKDGATASQRFSVRGARQFRFGPCARQIVCPTNLLPPSRLGFLPVKVSLLNLEGICPDERRGDRVLKPGPVFGGFSGTEKKAYGICHLKTLFVRDTSR